MLYLPTRRLSSGDYVFRPIGPRPGFESRLLAPGRKVSSVRPNKIVDWIFSSDTFSIILQELNILTQDVLAELKVDSQKCHLEPSLNHKT